MTLDAERWFASRGWTPFDFQREVWAAMARGESGLLHANTGSGKTYAVWMGALQRMQETVELAGARRLVEGAGAGGGAVRSAGEAKAPALQVLWLTPMRALAADTTRALALPLPEMAPEITVGQRTGDTPSAERARQDKRWPSALVTTPESLSLLLTRARAADELAGVHTVIVDEWHELIGSKRGVQVQLALARLARWNPALVVWGLSATLGNLEQAMDTLTGRGGTLVRGRVDKTIVIDTLLPRDPGRFSWGGHLGAQMQQPVVDEIERTMHESGGTTLVFTNVRSQAEIWYRLLLDARPEWAGRIALHHGSLDREVREWVEAGLKDGSLKAVVATSSLDLGVDFLPVERVLQIGSPKGVARLLQRAGRSGHAPGRTSRVTLVPTHTLELVEAAAARRAAQAGRVESRASPEQPLDVLVQHLVTVGLGGGFTPDALYDEVRSAPAYRGLTRAAFDWALAFVERGGESLGAYPQYHRVVRGEDGVCRVTDRGIALRHRLQVGTIVSDASMQVAWLTGGRIGTIEESFIARLRAGDCFVFGGRVLEYVRTQDMTAYVRKATKARGVVPAWSGTKMALSEAMTDMVQALLREAAGAGPPHARGAPPRAGRAQGELGAPVLAQGDFLEPEMQAARPMLDAQARLSRIPTPGTLLVERFRSNEGCHLFLYPFGGRHVHMGLAQLLAWRLSRQAPNTFSLSINDFGLELLAAQEVDLAPLQDRSAFTTRALMADVLASLNTGELAQRRFREIARVAGLVFSGYPGAPKSTRQLQASSSLFWEVFRKYDKGNRLLTQAEGEVLAQELELSRLSATLKRMSAQRVEVVDLAVPSPFALPLMVERFREELSTEKLADRLQRMLAEAQRVLDEAPQREELPPARRRRARARG
ncbi:MAG TPA: ligase-associated DNA damage response DEXH box helicase [Burkholderiaceae bacterium]|nr:ligase-associated DNA damage response DEXH box helicase [Burkholderiaceae bacterium]